MDSNQQWCCVVSGLTILIALLVSILTLFLYVNGGDFFGRFEAEEENKEKSICGDTLFGGICDQHHVCSEYYAKGSSSSGDGELIAVCKCPLGFHGEKCKQVCRRANRPKFIALNPKDQKPENLSFWRFLAKLGFLRFIKMTNFKVGMTSAVAELALITRY